MTTKTTTADLAIKATIETIQGCRDAALTKYREAFEHYKVNQQMLGQAWTLAEQASPGYNVRPTEAEAKAIKKAWRGDDAEKYVELIRRSIDRDVWHYLLNAHGFSKFMDRKAKEEFEALLRENPPAPTPETVHATLADLVADRDVYLRRGIALAFAQLDRRFRSHDGFKIGDRVVIPWAISYHGWVNDDRAEVRVIHDIERVFFTLDGKPVPEDYGGIVGKLSEQLHQRNYAGTVSNAYIRLRFFKNLNVHLWFTRKDLLVQVNKLLAEHYGEVLGQDADSAEPDHLVRREMVVAKNLGFFETPTKVARDVVDRINTYFKKPPRVLEPSAGTGRLVQAILEDYPKAVVHCVELEPARAAQLAESYKTYCQDFLQLSPTTTGLYDIVAMNPPFDHQLDIDHVAHAIKFVKPGGCLVSVMSAGVEFRENNRAKAFRKLVARYHGEFFDLPAGAFAESGTNVNTCVVRLRIPD